MVGIYKITNLINGHFYIGQSTQIEGRWSDHKIAGLNKNSPSYEYPLYRAFRKYGLENFSFEIIEECSNDQLNEKENYWINLLNPEYNQTIGQDYQIVPQKLSLKQVKEIQKLLLNDKNGQISHKELAEKYNVNKDTIRDINVGRTWYNSKFNYPLHYSKYDAKNPNNQHFCLKCGKKIWSNSTTNLCINCYNELKRKDISFLPITREELKQLIRTIPFTTIGKKYNVSDNTIRKWCDKFNLPRKVSDIKKYSDEEWNNL